MKRWLWLFALWIILPLNVLAQDSAPGTPEPTCYPDAPQSWESLVEDTDALLEESREEFAQGSLVLSPAHERIVRQLALDWIDMNERWREIEVPDGREIIQFTANRMAGHLSSTLTYMLDGSIDEFQLGKTAEAMEAYTVAEASFVLLQIPCIVNS